MRIIFTLFLLVAGTFCSMGQGYYVEYKLTTPGSEMKLTGTMKMYSQGNNSRTEMNMGTGIGQMNIVSLIMASSPATVYLLNEKNKTYSTFTSTDDRDWKDYPTTDYEISIIGKEKVNDYNTTHARVKVKNSSTAMDMWTTTEISGYTDFALLKSKYTGKANMLKAMDVKGAAGFPVRVSTKEEGQSIQMDLVTAEKRNNPSALFSINGYTKGNGASVMPGGLDVNEMMQQIQNMTPEEREQWIKQMKDAYQPK